MGKEVEELRRIVGRVPRPTSKELDLASFPIDSILKRVVERDNMEFVEKTKHDISCSSALCLRTS